VFAIFFPPQRIAHTQIVPRDSRQGFTPANNTFPTFIHGHSFKTHKNLIPQFFRQQLHRLCPGAVGFCVFTRRAGFRVIQR